MKNTLNTTSNVREKNRVSNVWMGSVKFISSVLAIVFGLCAPITSTAAEVLIAGEFFQLQTTSARDLRGAVITLTEKGRESTDWTDAAQFKQLAKTEKWNSKWDMLEPKFNKFLAEMLTNGVNEDQWKKMGKSIKDISGNSGLKEFNSIFPIGASTVKVGTLTRALWQKGN
jgi:hypothetical protein